MTDVALGLRLMAALRGGAMFVARPHGMVHVYSGPCTRNGSAVPRGHRPVCGARTRRLSVIVRPGGAVDLGQHERFCRRCTSTLGPSLGVDVQQLVTRDDWADAYGHLQVVDLVQAARWARTEAETYQIGTVSSIVLGGMPHTRPVDQVLIPIRTALRSRGLSPEQRAERDAIRQAQIEQDQRVAAARRRGQQMDRAIDRRAAGGYLAPWERELLDTA